MRTKRYSKVLLIAVAVFLAFAITASADIVTTDLKFNWTADSDTAGDAVWTDTNNSKDMDFDTGSTSPIDVNDGGVSFSKAYSFPGDVLTYENSYDYFSEEKRSKNPSFELWFKPSTLSGNQMLFESGGEGRGFSFALYDNTLKFEAVVDRFDENDLDEYLSLEKAGITTDWQQIVGVIHANGGSDMYLYHNGELAAELTAGQWFNDWCNGNEAGLGQVAGTTAANDGSWSGDDFTGEISVLRFYTSMLDADDVAQNYAAIIPEPATFGMLGFFGIVYILRRKLYDDK